MMLIFGMGIATYLVQFTITTRLFFLKEQHMNNDRIEGNWKEMKGKVQQQWGKLTDDDLDVIDGRREELVGKIQQAYGKSREEAEKEVDNHFN